MATEGKIRWTHFKLRAAVRDSEARAMAGPVIEVSAPQTIEGKWIYA